LRGRARHPVHLDETPLVQGNARLVAAYPRRARHHADGEQAVRPGQRPAVGKRDHDAVPLAAHRFGPGPAEHVHATAAEHVLDDDRGVLVLVRQHPVPRRHQRDLGTERLVGAGELGAGHPGPDDDQPLGQLGEIIDLAAGEDPLPIRSGVRQFPGVSPCRDQHDVGSDRGSPRLDDARARHPAPGLDNPDSLGGHALGDVVRLRRGERLNPRVQGGCVNVELGIPAVFELQAECRGTPKRGHRGRGLDQRLGRNTVSEHTGTTEADFIDDGYLGAELRGHQGGLVPPRASAEYHDTWTWQGHVN
jgi:hypothetical protein